MRCRSLECSFSSALISTSRAYWLLACALFAFVAAPAWAAELVGRVVGVHDGDTLTLLVERQEVKIRLDQVDAPELGQPFGRRSKQSLSETVYRKDVRAVTSGTDRFGRTIGTVYIEGVDVNEEQVRRGMAWVYRKYARDKKLYDIEEEARVGRRGLWADAEPVPPWEWRRRRR